MPPKSARKKGKKPTSIAPENIALENIAPEDIAPEDIALEAVVPECFSWDPKAREQNAKQELGAAEPEKEPEKDTDYGGCMPGMVYELLANLTEQLERARIPEKDGYVPMHRIAQKCVRHFALAHIRHFLADRQSSAVPPFSNPNAYDEEEWTLVTAFEEETRCGIQKAWVRRILSGEDEMCVVAQRSFEDPSAVTRTNSTAFLMRKLQLVLRETVRQTFARKRPGSPAGSVDPTNLKRARSWIPAQEGGSHPDLR